MTWRRVGALVLLLVAAVTACAEYNDCNGHGQCTADGLFCECDRAFRGLSCNIPPYELISDEFIPGQLAADKEQYYRVLSENFQAGDLLTVTPQVEGATFYLMASIGVPPTRAEAEGEWNFQFGNVSDVAGEKDLLIPNRNPADPDNIGDSVLYIAVYVPPTGTESRYLLIHWDESAKFGLIRGVPNAATYSIFAVLGACVCLSLCGAVIFVVVRSKRGGGGGAAGGAQRQQGGIEMAGGLTNDYPSMQEPTMQPGYAGGRAPAQTVGGYDNTQLANPYGGSDAAPYSAAMTAESAQFARGQSFVGGDQPPGMGAYAQQHSQHFGGYPGGGSVQGFEQGGFAQAGGGFDQFGNVDSMAGGGQPQQFEMQAGYGNQFSTQSDGYHMDQTMQALW